jgi:hypothetical protein
MKTLTKILIPVVASFLNINSAKNTYYVDKNSAEYKNELNSKKKEYYESTIKSIFPQVDSIKYRRDIDIHGIREFWQTPYETDSLKSGDCEDKTFFTYSLLKNKGLDVKIVWGKLNNTSTVGHFWLEYKIGKEGYIIETASKSGAKIIKKDTIDFKKKYIKYLLSYHKLNLIDDFENFSGLELEFSNPSIK